MIDYAIDWSTEIEAKGPMDVHPVVRLMENLLFHRFFFMIFPMAAAKSEINAWWSIWQLVNLYPLIITTPVFG